MCDSTTLIALARTGHLDILKKTVKTLVIPMAVYEEVVVKGHQRPGAAEVKEAGWIEKKATSQREMVTKLNVVLDAGESEAIALAKEIGADLVVLDDKKARKMARSEGLKVAGLLAVLMQAKQLGVIENLQSLLDELKHKGFFINEELYHHVIQEVGE